MPTQKPSKCPHCGSARLTPMTELGNQSPISLYFDVQQEKKTWLGNPPEDIDIDRARVCLDCGYVLFFCLPKHVEKLRAIEAKLLARGIND